MTIRTALGSAAERLERHRVSNARLTAEVLLAHILSVDREYLYAHDDRVLTEPELQAIEDALYDRIGGIPLQYIVGRQEFYGRYFHVTPDVLIPRPETEYIIDSVLEAVHEKVERRTRGQTGQPPLAPKILDVGTGSGCIAVTLALELPGSQIFAGDISEAALKVARENAAMLGASVGFVCMDVMEAISGSFDFVVSNPPYVRPEEMLWLQREVREHEPHIALFSPEDELGIYRRLVLRAQDLLRPGSHLVMEIGIAMEEKVLDLFGAGWAKLPTKTDLQGIPRTVIARRVS